MGVNKRGFYTPWGYQEENDYASSKTLFEIELEKLFAGSKYNKDDKKIHFYNLEGKDLGNSIDTTEFSSGVIEDASYDPTTKILTITFSNGDKVEINFADLIDETEFGDGLQVNGGIVSIKLANGDGTEKYLSVDENGISASLLGAVVDEIKESIQAEIDRATAAEADLQATIDQEVADREADVDAEQTRAEAAEQALQAAIDQERTDREADVDAEETRAKAAEQTLTTNLANEVTRSTNKDNDHDAQLNIADQRLDLLEAQLPAEVSRAKAAEQALQAAIDAEASRAASAETDLQAAITAEGQRAQDAETALENKIDDAVSALTDAIVGETNRAKAAEEDLQNQLDNLGSNKFDDVDYDSSAKTINFYAEGSLVKALDATPFIKDGMIDRVYIDTDAQELVIVWNSASGKEETRIPLSDIFNPANYYTKDEIDDKVDTINSAITAVEGDITTIQGDITTIEGDITNINSAITNVQGDITNINSSITEINSSITEINEAIDDMEDQYGDEISALTDSVRELEETVENDEFTISMALNDLNTRKLDASAYTPTDLSNYYTKSETNTVVNGAKIYQVSVGYDVPTQEPVYLNIENNDGETKTADMSMFASKSYVDAHEPDLSDYYTKEEIDEADRVVATALNDLDSRVIELDERKLDASAYTPTDLSNYYTKSETDARDLWVSGTGTNSVVMKGTNNTANGINACAEGNGTNAAGQFSHAEGNQSIASGNDSHAEGTASSATTNSAHAEGFHTLASGGYSHAEGYATVARGNFTHVEGNATSATTSYAHAEGEGTLAKGAHSHVEGYKTITSNDGEHASGKFNVSNTGLTSAAKTLFSIGNGSGEDSRHNAFEVRENGDIYININGNDVLLQDYITELESVVARALVDLDARLKALEP